MWSWGSHIKTHNQKAAWTKLFPENNRYIIIFYSECFVPKKILSSLVKGLLSKKFRQVMRYGIQLKKILWMQSAYVIFSSPIIYNHVNCSIVFKKSIKWVGFPESNISTMIIPPSIYRFITKRLIQPTCPF